MLLSRLHCRMCQAHSLPPLRTRVRPHLAGASLWSIQPACLIRSLHCWPSAATFTRSPKLQPLHRLRALSLAASAPRALAGSGGRRCPNTATRMLKNLPCGGMRQEWPWHLFSRCAYLLHHLFRPQPRLTALPWGTYVWALSMPGLWFSMAGQQTMPMLRSATNSFFERHSF